MLINKLYIVDAGYIKYGLFQLAQDCGSYLLCHGRSNMNGQVLSLKVINENNTVSCVKFMQQKGRNIKDLRNVRRNNVLDMKVRVKYKEQTTGKFSETEVRVIRYPDNSGNGKFGFIVTNLPETVPAEPTSVVPSAAMNTLPGLRSISVMQPTCWQI